MFASGCLAQRLPCPHGDLAVGFRCHHQDYLGRVDIGDDPRQALIGALGVHAVQRLQMRHLVPGLPGHALDAVADAVHQRTQGGETLVDMRVVALHLDHQRHGLAGDGLAFALLPVLRFEGLGDLVGAVMLDGIEHHIRLFAEHLRCDLGERLGDALVDFPVAARLPPRIDRAGQRMDERMHVGGVQVVLLVPGRRGQHDVRIDAGGGHPEIQRHQQVQLSFRRMLVPDGLGRLGAPLDTEILAEHAMRGSQQMLQEILMPLARRAQQVGAPDEHIARPVLRIVGVLAGQFQRAVLQRPCDIVLCRKPGGGGILRHLQRVGFELRRGWQPTHPLGADVVVDDRAIPRATLGAGRRRRRYQVADIHRLVAPLVGMGVEGRGGVLLARRTAPVQGERQRRPAGLRAQFLLPDIMRPAAAGLADAAAQHQHVDHAAIVHVGMEPVVHRRADDDHRAALGLFRVGGELARHLHDLVARDPGDGLGPGRRVRGGVVIARRHVLSAEATVHAVVGQEQVMHAGDHRLAIG